MSKKVNKYIAITFFLITLRMNFDIKMLIFFVLSNCMLSISIGNLSWKIHPATSGSLKNCTYLFATGIAVGC